MSQKNLIGTTDFIATLIEWRDHYFFNTVYAEVLSGFTFGKYNYASFDELQTEHLENPLHTSNIPVIYVSNEKDLPLLEEELNVTDLNKRDFYEGEDFFDLLLRELLYHPKYRHSIYHVDIPNSYRKFIKILFDDLKQDLPKTKDYRIAHESKVVISNGKTPLEIRNYNKEIVISPAFARALFLFSTGDFLEDLEDMRQSDQKDWLVGAHESLIFAQMRSAFAFFIHHEFAHLYLKDNDEITIENIEAVCDCYATYYMKEQTKKDLKAGFDTSGRLTIWFLLMEKVIELQKQKYWKIHDTLSISSRSKLIKNYSVSNPENCIRAIDSMRNIHD